VLHLLVCLFTLFLYIYILRLYLFTINLPFLVNKSFTFDSHIYLEQVKKFENRSNVMKLRSFGDSTSSRVEDKLKAIRLCSR